MKIEYNDLKHTYKIEERVIPSVTQILKETISKPGLIQWAANQAVEYISLHNSLEPEILERAKYHHKSIRDDSAGIGKEVHKWFENYIKKGKDKLPRKKLIKNIVKPFYDWSKENNVKFLESELIVYSPKYDYCGTLDFLAEVDGEIYLGDVKTSKKIYGEFLLQTAAYQQAYSELYPSVKISKRIIVKLDKTGKNEFETLITDEFKEDFEAFESALILNRRLKKLK